MKKMILLIIFILFSLLFTSCENKIEKKLTQKEICENGDGLWKTFSNGCRNSCDYERNKQEILCTQSFTEGCGCKTGECWNGSKCEKI